MVLEELPLSWEDLLRGKERWQSFLKVTEKGSKDVWGGGGKRGGGGWIVKLVPKDKRNLRTSLQRRRHIAEAKHHKPNKNEPT